MGVLWAFYSRDRCNPATGAPDGPTLARSSTAMSIATIFRFYREVKAGLNRGQR
jgi:hypothetical protein